MAERRGGALPQALAWNDPTGEQTALVELHGYAKRNTQQTPNVVANELVAFRLGTLLGLPMVPGAPMLVPPDHQEVAWISLAFDGDIRKTTPSVAPEVVAENHPDQAAGTVVFDLLIANHDRHPRNLAYRKRGRKGERLGLFDHDHALWGNSGLTPGEHLKHVTNRFMLDGPGLSGLRRNAHCLLPHLADYGLLMKWCDRVDQLLTDTAVGQVCWEAADLPGALGPTKGDAERLQDLLRLRRSELQPMIRNNLDKFPCLDVDEERLW